MTDLAEIYSQLSKLAQQTNTPIEDLLNDLTHYSNGQQSDPVEKTDADPLTVATELVTKSLTIDTQFEVLFEHLSELMTFDIGIGLTNDGGVSTIHYIQSYIPNNLEVGQTLDIVAIDSFLTEATIWNHSTTEPIVSLLPDIDVKSALIFPVINSDEIIGYLLFTHHKENGFTSSTVEKLRPFVNLASGSMQSTRLMTTVSQSADELATLYHATSVLFRADSLTDFASQITEVVVRTFHYADCGLMVVNQDKQEITRIRRAGPEMAMPTHRILMDGQGLVPKAVREEHMVYAPDVRESPDYVTGDERSLSELVVPLKGTQKILGVLDFQASVIDAFSDRDQRLMVAFAERVAPILENVLLYDELRQYAIQLESHVAERTLELQQTKEELETIIRSSPDAIVLLDKKGIIKQGNLAWLSMVGVSYPEVHDNPIVKFLNSEDRETFQEALKQTLEDELENDISVILHNKSFHRDIPVEVSIAPILEGREGGAVCNIRDMTQHKETERVLREALDKSKELSELKTKFVTMASHEFRTPLTTILSSSDIVSTYYDRLSTQAILSHLQKIIREVGYLNKLIEDIVIIGRDGDEGFKPNFAVHDLIDLVRKRVNHVKVNDGNHHPIRVKISDRCRSVITDEKLITYIIDNVVENACKYSPEGEPILLEITYVNVIRITVRDKGIGIPQADLEHLFDTFYRGNNVGNIRGTGIGLAIAHDAIVAMGGQIDVRSKVNSGTVVSIQLPLQSEDVLE